LIADGKSRAALPVASAHGWLGADGGFESRWVICGLLFLATSLNYLDRQVFSILIPDLQDNLHISELAYGRLVMAFQLSYALVMVGAGKVLDRIGARVGLAISVSFGRLQKSAIPWRARPLDLVLRGFPWVLAKPLTSRLVSN
jgi:MFS family permease